VAVFDRRAAGFKRNVARGGDLTGIAPRSLDRARAACTKRASIKVHPAAPSWLREVAIGAEAMSVLDILAGPSTS